jgi:hypothetical protein
MMHFIDQNIRKKYQNISKKHKIMILFGKENIKQSYKIMMLLSGHLDMKVKDMSKV